MLDKNSIALCGRYRRRDPELVIDEIRQVLGEYRRYRAGRGSNLVVDLVRENARFMKDRARGIFQGQQSVGQVLRGMVDPGIQSIFFDDDTWNLGPARIAALCRGLKEIGLPWTMMGRIDTTERPLFDLMVDSGCVGMRFGVESFNQRLLDNTKKHLSAATSQENIRYLLTHFSGLEFHFTTMKMGTGLGLSITRLILEAQGGSIEFDSEPGQGAIFSILLPVATSVSLAS